MQTSLTSCTQRLLLSFLPSADWPALYDVGKLQQNTVPVAAATYYEASAASAMPLEEPHTTSLQAKRQQQGGM